MTTDTRRTGAFRQLRNERRYWILTTALTLLAVALIWGLLSYRNPMEFGTQGYWLIARRRANSVLVMALVALCQAMATVAFHTVTNNRIITPSIMGFESLYVAIHTSIIYFFGAAGLNDSHTVGMFVLQLAVMVGFSLLLYSWLLAGSHNLHAMLLVGVVIGGGLGSLSTFMQRMLTPSEFDVLTARLFGSVNNAAAEYFPIAIPLAVGAAVLLFLHSRKLNVLTLGRDATVNLGISHRANTIYTLVLVSILMAISTALVGPMTFLGFLVATLTYLVVDSYDHRYIFPVATLIAFCVLAGAYFLMNHVFYAQGVVSVIIELVGGIAFLVVILRKGSL